ncbi:hypothetical protein K2Z84_33990 [Candidatus Binatia bacterium]|nr:hypothetical protein [Candidatus Binatia bacterium]
MNRPHPTIARGASADRIAAAALAVVLACAPPVGAACAGGESASGAGGCTAQAPSAADAGGESRPADAAPAVDGAAAPEGAVDQGRRELAAAKKLIDDGERAPDDDARKKAYEEAKQHADRAVELMPNDADAHFVQFAAEGRIAQLGGIAVAALQLVKLNKQLDEVLRLDPNHANALAARGGMLMKLPRIFGGNTTKGVEYLEKAVALDSTAIGKRLELAEAYHIVGREDDAKATAQSALEVAKQLDQPERVATCERFIVELAKSCSGCAVASIGR